MNRGSWSGWPGEIHRASVANMSATLTGVVSGDTQHGFHVAVPGGEDQPVALCHQVAQHTLGVAAFAHRRHRGDADPVAERVFDGLARAVVRKRRSAPGTRAAAGATPMKPWIDCTWPHGLYDSWIRSGQHKAECVVLGCWPLPSRQPGFSDW